MICVDWANGATDPNYVRAAVNTRLVGKQLAILIESLSRHFKTNINAITHIVGFSLGAHVAGFAGTQLKNLSRITGNLVQGGSRQSKTGWALLSNDDVILLMTSLLLFNPAQKLGGSRPTRPTPHRTF